MYSNNLSVFQFLKILHLFPYYTEVKTKTKTDLYADLTSDYPGLDCCSITGWSPKRQIPFPPPFLRVSGPHLSFLNETDILLIETSQEHVFVPHLISWWKCSPPVDPNFRPPPAQACRPLVFIFSRTFNDFLEVLQIITHADERGKRSQGASCLNTMWDFLGQVSR